LPHDSEISLPQAATDEIEDMSSFRAPDKIPKGYVHCPAICFHACCPHGFLQQIFIKHKICTFHMHIIHGQKMSYEIKIAQRANCKTSEAVSKFAIYRAFSPCYFSLFQSQGFALGWYGIAPLALKLLKY
jgi:hypothetical protein